MSALRRFGVLTAISLLITMAFAVYDSYGELAFSGMITPYRNAYLWRVFLLQLAELTPLAVVTVSVVTFTLAISPFDLGGQGALTGAIRPVLVFIVGLGVLFGVWVGVVGPRVTLRVQQMEYHSRIATTAMSDAETARDAGHLEDAERYGRIYRSVMGGSDEIDTFLETVQEARMALAQAERIAGYRAAAIEPGPRQKELVELTVPQLLGQAREFFDEGQYFSAHYYATRAVEQEPGRTDARELQARALNAIEGGIFEMQDRDQRDFFRRKMDAYQRLLRDDPESVIKGYYQFQELEREVARAGGTDDPDIEHYLALAQEKVKEISFFVDEAEVYSRDAFAGRNDLVFRNRRTDILTEYVTIERLVSTDEGDYFFDIEVLQLRDDGALHFQADYGKRLGDDLFFRAIRQDSAGYGENDRVFVPERLGGDSEARPEAFIPLQFSTADIILLAGGPGMIPTLSLMELFSLPQRLLSLGQPAEMAVRAVAARLLSIFGFFIAAFWGIALGWSNRSHYLGRPPFWVLLAVPVIPWAFWLLRDLPGLALSLLVRGLLVFLSPSMVIVTVVALLFLGVIVSVTLLGRCRIEP